VPADTDYRLEISADDAALVVELRGQVTPDAGRHLRQIVWAATKIGVPVEVRLPHTSGRVGASRQLRFE
jgi:hypothetical protein